VLINLLGNAIKFTEHGEVCLRVAYRDGVLQLRVSDSGLGIDPAQHEEIFKPFAQTGESRYKVQGTGLGLAITRKILEVMRGTITLHSELGKGTCFEVAIPLAASDDVLPPPCSREPVDSDIIGYCSPLGDVRILLVDDVADNRLVLQQLLEPLGFNISQADSGEQCLQQLSSLNPHLILMDLRMPGIDGLETTPPHSQFSRICHPAHYQYLRQQLCRRSHRHCHRRLHHAPRQTGTTRYLAGNSAPISPPALGQKQHRHPCYPSSQYSQYAKRHPMQ